MEGTAFGHYQLLTLLGRGGMGEVWRAHDTAVDREVALKVLLPEPSSDLGFAERFRHEVRDAAQLDNPHVVPIHEYGEIDGRLFVDMRLIDGSDLAAVLASGPLDLARAVGIVEQVAAALQAAHEIGLIHGDVKPSNILLDTDDDAYLIDFGIAIAIATNETSLTSSGAVTGTRQYMAPERRRSQHVDGRSDVYALTCVLYETLTGNRPHLDADTESQVAERLTTTPPYPTSIDPNLPPDLDTVVATGMAENPDDRYPTAVELAEAARDAITAPPQTGLLDGVEPALAARGAAPWWRNTAARTSIAIAIAAVTITMIIVVDLRMASHATTADSSSATTSVSATASSGSGGDSPGAEEPTLEPRAPLASSACLDVSGANLDLTVATTAAEAQKAADALVKYDPPTSVKQAIDHFVGTGGAHFDDPDYAKFNDRVDAWVKAVCPLP